ncbi:hypothetical protein [Streptococcus suis]|uniref:hypothetical protein n=1 Tax=Streptococcus suis TaxID=1307 RepID=UPI000CF371CF|nr:hypothetical protein [Streptococcus suis]
MFKNEDLLERIINEIPKLDSSSDYWLIRSNSGEYYTDFNINSYIGIGWNEITLQDIIGANNSTDQLKPILKQKMKIDSEKEPTENVFGSAAGQMLRFVNNIKINDIVVVPSEKSERFLVGKVTGRPFEISEKELIDSIDEESHYTKSNFKKRIKVRWMGWFRREDADSALYKMIYTHNTLSTVNDYRSFINRALLPYYIQDDKLYLTYKVTETSDIQGMYLGQFVYHYSEINFLLFPENRLDSKVNVQSNGVIEFISESVKAGLLIFFLVASGGITLLGGKVILLGKEFEAPGILQSIKSYTQNSKEKQIDLDTKQLDYLKKAVDTAQKLNVPISTLGIKTPEGFAEKIQEQLEQQNKKK